MEKLTKILRNRVKKKGQDNKSAGLATHDNFSREQVTGNNIRDFKTMSKTHKKNKLHSTQE